MLLMAVCLQLVEEREEAVSTESGNVLNIQAVVSYTNHNGNTMLREYFRKTAVGDSTLISPDL